MRTCTRCNNNLPDEMFYKHPSIKPDGIRKMCHRCRQEGRRKQHAIDPQIKREQSKKWRERRRAHVNASAREYRKKHPDKFKGYSLEKDFGISLSQYQELLKIQKDVCKLCGKPERTKHQSGKLKELAVDHCHSTGVIRGLLCWVCNTGIGKLQDDPSLLRKAADYIESYKENKMPLYQYHCEKCERTFETLQKFSDEPLTVCDYGECGGKVTKLFPTSTTFIEGKRYAANPYMKKGR